MNAHELADWLEQVEHELQGKSQFKLSRASYMLRQQADRIAELEKAQIKELSDEEIIEIRDSCYVQSGIDEWEFDDIVFARAILKKASER
jgi:hypothetical protein